MAEILHRLSMNCCSRHDFPVPASPMIKNFRRKSRGECQEIVSTPYPWSERCSGICYGWRGVVANNRSTVSVPFASASTALTKTNSRPLSPPSPFSISFETFILFEVSIPFESSMTIHGEIDMDRTHRNCFTFSISHRYLSCEFKSFISI